MDDIWSLGRVPYEAAKPFRNKSTMENLMDALQFFFDFVKLLFLSIPIYAMYVREFFSKEPKKIAGQLALVRLQKFLYYE